MKNLGKTFLERLSERASKAYKVQLDGPLEPELQNSIFHNRGSNFLRKFGSQAAHLTKILLVQLALGGYVPGNDW